MDLALRGKAVLVTGGSRGIGREIALHFAAEGASVAICGRDPGRLDEAHAALRALGGPCLAIRADLFSAADCVRVVEETAATFGRFDVLVSNASTNVSGRVMTSSDEVLMERVMGKTLATIRLARAAIPHMRRVGGGRIICIGGTSSRSPAGATLPSGLGNASVSNLVKHLSDEVAPDQITVNVVHPYFTKTDRYPERVAARARERGISLAEAEASFAADFPIGRVVEPRDIAPLVLFLASPHASAITGQAIAVDGGAVRWVAY
jgi:3-oxoacyl-[acyl-carrier protein] reductase